ncbi:hypothetical protein HRbin26_00947 [bacterium HR26]|nr:hypothetical protein HRbin26_00947 [bacterium HR26]
MPGQEVPYLAEAACLFPEKPGVGLVGGGEVGEEALQLQPRVGDDRLRELQGLIYLDAEPAHPGIDLEVQPRRAKIPAGSSGDSRDVDRRAHSQRQVGVERRLEQGVVRRAEHQHRRGDAGAAES